MCSVPKIPTTKQTVQPQVAPTYADASISKASVNTRNKAAALAGRDIKTTSRGLSDDANVKKKNLLGD